MWNIPIKSNISRLAALIRRHHDNPLGPPALDGWQQGKHLVKIDPWFASSKACYICQHKMEAMPLTVRSWNCPACHTQHDRDINAALNIKHQGILKLKAQGLSVSAHEGSRKSGMSPAVA